MRITDLDATSVESEQAIQCACKTITQGNINILKSAWNNNIRSDGNRHGIHEGGGKGADVMGLCRVQQR